MALVFRKITKRVFIIANLIIACVFLLACCNAFLNPQTWWFIALLGLAFPFLFILVACFLILWLIFKSRWALLSLGCLLVSYPHIRAIWAFNYGKEVKASKPKGSLRILTWNVTWFDEQTKVDKSRTSYGQKMFDFIKSQDADVLCFQEYVEPNTPKIPYNNRADISKLGYPYSILAPDYIGYKGKFQSGVAIFSKYPILDSIRLHYPGPKNFRAGESLIAADINFNGRKIRVYTTYLQSVMFHKGDYRKIEILKSASDSMYEAGKSIVHKLGMGYKFRGGRPILYGTIWIGALIRRLFAVTLMMFLTLILTLQ